MQGIKSAGLVAVGLSSAMVLAMSLAAAPASAAQGSLVPGGLQVSRSSGAGALDVSWRPVSGADHYTVNVFDGERDRSYPVPANSTSLTVPVSGGVCARYAVQVSAHSDTGELGRTDPFRIERLAPGGITQVTPQRDMLGGTASISWAAPVSSGGAAVSGYRVQITQLNNGNELLDRTSMSQDATVTGLDPERQYVAKVTAQNSYGSCYTSRTVLAGVKPTAVPRVLVERSTADINDVIVSWSPPGWRGNSTISRYEIGYRSGGMRRPEWQSAGLSTRGVLRLDPNKKWGIWVRVVNSNGHGTISKEIKLGRAYDIVSEPDPQVDIVESDGVVVAHLSPNAGSSRTYTSVRFSVAPTAGGRGFRDTRVVTTGAREVVFDRLPCGNFTVVVTGQGATTSREFGRAVVNRCSA